MWCWSRISSVKWEDSWAERLRFLGEGNVVFVEWPNGRTLKIEAYTDEKTTIKLVKEFGGKAAPAKNWLTTQKAPAKPISIRGQLRIFASVDGFESRVIRPKAGTKDLLVPAGMAFGTGDHATTLTCLRMLCDASRSVPRKWSALDAGCGTGILGLAAAALGASPVDAFDFDSLAVRTAKENLARNPGCRIRVKRADIHDWEPTRTYDIVMANLFSELLIQSAGKLTSALADDGTMILSGVLRAQLPEVRDALEARSLTMNRIVYLGKWTAAVCKRR